MYKENAKTILHLKQISFFVHIQQNAAQRKLQPTKQGSDCNRRNVEH